jgi:hypothetical protein
VRACAQEGERGRGRGRGRENQCGYHVKVSPGLSLASVQTCAAAIQSPSKHAPGSKQELLPKVDTSFKGSLLTGHVGILGAASSAAALCSDRLLDQTPWCERSLP